MDLAQRCVLGGQYLTEWAGKIPVDGIQECPSVGVHLLSAAKTTLPTTKNTLVSPISGMQQVTFHIHL